MIKEATASAFVFHRGADGLWRVGLVWHPRLEAWMPPGGHVEDDESAAEAAVRELAEETGLRPRLLSAGSAPLPAGFPHALLPAPWWTVEMAAGADNHTREPHVHVDHVFLAVTDDLTPVSEPVHEVRWFTEAELAECPDISEDSRIQAKELIADFPRISEAATAC